MINTGSTNSRPVTSIICAPHHRLSEKRIPGRAIDHTIPTRTDQSIRFQLTCR
ncbi:hypothetical protein [Taibaiella koreensis]|uniref:hypothetical protein n=1 Tax=Taibaiella koreensis TaxID=1268548 RepID=UPI0019695E1E|nr:hypothetical protein [Taibaiella koreensis]